MALMRRELPSGTIRMKPRRPRLRGHPLSSAILATLAVFVAYQVLGSAVFWVQLRLDDLRYGYPRSYQVDGYVGFGEANGLPTHFIALNLHRQVMIYAIAGSDPTHVLIIKGPYLFGTNEEYAPVRLRLIDVTGDGYPDLVLDVDHQHMVYVDEPRLGTFRPLLPQERTAAARVLPSG
jgi:hypothetical protein